MKMLTIPMHLLITLKSYINPKLLVDGEASLLYCESEPLLTLDPIKQEESYDLLLDSFAPKIADVLRAAEQVDFWLDSACYAEIYEKNASIVRIEVMFRLYFNDFIDMDSVRKCFDGVNMDLFIHQESSLYQQFIHELKECAKSIQKEDIEDDKLQQYIDGAEVVLKRGIQCLEISTLGIVEETNVEKI